jgi:hypothetical protein
MARAKSTSATGEKKTTTRTKKTVAPSPVPSNGSTVEVVNVEEKIRARAYELYEGRGRQHGAHERDWFIAEAEVRSHTA